MKPARFRRLSTTLRIGAVAALLALASNLAVLGFIRWHTQDDALGLLHARVVAEARPLADVAASAGRPALTAAIGDALEAEDPALLIGLFAPDGSMRAGNLRPLPVADRRPGFRVATVGTRAGETVEAGLLVSPIGRDLLVSGREVGEGLAFQRTLERSLALSVVLSLLLGLLGGLAVARYAARRVRAISAVVDAVGEGDFARRIVVPGAGAGGDAFDALGVRINAMLDRIATLMGELRVLTDGLAHDLRSPLGRLRARIERALVAEDESTRDAALTGVMSEADALMRILSTVLEIGRVEAGGGQRNFAWLDPGALIHELAEMYEPLAEEKGTVLTVELDGVLLPLHAHRQLLAQSLANLVDNALNHAAIGGALTLVAIQREDGLSLGVTDNGPGIAEADRGEALRRFGRLDASRSAPGAGLGLALVDAVAHLHGATFALSDNQPGLRALVHFPANRGRLAA